MASLLFDRFTRERAWLLYAWCRACDDLADGQVMGHGMQAVADPAERLETIRRRTALALAGEPTGDPAFDGFGVVARECAIPPRLADDLIDGFALDAAGWAPQSEDDLYRYCYHVAGVVGVMMALVMGVPPDATETLDRACDLGLAFQLANIARDIGEDHESGRLYLPADWLNEHGLSRSELMAPQHRPIVAEVARRLADRAAQFEASARSGTAALSFRAGWAVLAAAGIYGGIARRVAQAGEQAWQGRITTSKAEKLGWLVRSGMQSWRRRSFRAVPQRLWVRPPA